MNKSFVNYKKKNNWLAWVAFLLYIIVVGGMITYTFFSFTYFKKPNLSLAFIIVITCFIFLFGFQQCYGLMCSLVGVFKKDKIYNNYNSIVKTTVVNNTKKVAICYTTCNDFIEHCFATAFNQTYKNIDVYVCDDSKDEKYINLINSLQKKYKFTISRRGNWGAKKRADNLNWFLDHYSEKYDYFAIMDADTYLDKNFVNDSLKYFKTYNDIAVVQAGVRAIKGNTNNFQDVITPNYTGDYHDYTRKGAIICEYICSYFEGHSCLIDLNVFRKTKFRFQKLGADDFPTTIEMLKRGYRVMLAPNILCYDEASPNYFAWKETNIKWEDSMSEFVKKYTCTLFFKCKIRLFDKLYMWYWSVLGMVTPVFILVITGLSFMPLYSISNGFSVETIKQWPLIAWVMSLIFLGLQGSISPAVSAIKRDSRIKTFRVSLLTCLFYFSIMPSQFLKFFTMIFTKKSLSISVKENRKIKWYEAFTKNWFDILFYIAFFGYIVFTCVWTKNWLFAINPYLLIMFMSFIAIFFMPTMSNKKFKEPKLLN